MLAALAAYNAGEKLPLWAHQWLRKFALGLLPAFLPHPAVPVSERLPEGRAEYVPSLDVVRERVLAAFDLEKQPGRNMLTELQTHINDDVLVTMLDLDVPVDEFAKSWNVQERTIKDRARRARRRRSPGPS